MREFVVNETTKLNNFLDNFFPEITNVQLNKLYKLKDIKINGARVNNSNVIVNIGDKVAVYIPEKDVMPLKVDIIYQDDNILIIDKEDGINSEGVFNYFKRERNIYFIHRIDRNTKGLLVFAKNIEAEKILLNAFLERAIVKKYLALVFGKFTQKEQTLTAYLKKDSELSKVYIYDKQVSNSQQIITKYKVLEEYEETSLIEVELITGKTHQIRAHLAYLGHYIIGDGKYGKEEINKHHNKSRQCLIAKYIKFEQLNGNLEYLNGKEFKSYKMF
jgi:23S rRNA pseudouridine955/2504/2580 synthase